MELPLETSFAGAVRKAFDEGRYVLITSTSSPKPDFATATEQEILAWAKSHTPPEDLIEAEIQQILRLCCGINTLADLKRDIDSGNYGWRNYDASVCIRDFGIIFGFLPANSH